MKMARQGMPPKQNYTRPDGRRGYADGDSYRRAMGSAPPQVPSNPTSHAKATKRYGVDGSKLPGATASSTGENPARQPYTDPVPASTPGMAHTDRAPLGGTAQVVGWLDGKFHPVVHANTNKHGGDGVDDPRLRTDGSRGLSWHATGGAQGERS